MEHFFRALNTDREDRLTCQECQDLLPDYIQAATEGRADEGQWGALAFHLEICPHCSSEYTALVELMELAWEERGVEPPLYPAPNLSFLRPEPDKKPWRLDDLGRLIVEFSAELLRTLQPPPSQLAYAKNALKSSRSSRTLCQFALKEAIQDLDVTITAKELPENPTHCTVIIEVNIPSKGGWPHLAGTEVTFKHQGKVLETQRTDAFGQAILEGIATDDLTRLVFEIAPRP
jgi:hypothetical protein